MECAGRARGDGALELVTRWDSMDSMDLMDKMDFNGQSI